MLFEQGQLQLKLQASLESKAKQTKQTNYRRPFHWFAPKQTLRRLATSAQRHRKQPVGCECIKLAASTEAFGGWLALRADPRYRARSNLCVRSARAACAASVFRLAALGSKPAGQTGCTTSNATTAAIAIAVAVALAAAAASRFETIEIAATTIIRVATSFRGFGARFPARRRLVSKRTAPANANEKDQTRAC